MSGLMYFDKGAFSPRYGDNFFTFEITEHKNVLSNDPCWCKETNVTMYVITVRRGMKTWQIEKRYSQFNNFAQEIGSMATGSMQLKDLMSKLPALPNKTWFSIVSDEKSIQSRRVGLFEYLEAVAKQLTMAKSIQGSPLEEFLDLSKVQ